AAGSGRSLVACGSGTGQIELGPVVAILARVEQVRSRAVGSGLSIKLATAWKIDPGNAAEVKGGLFLGQPGEILAKDHCVARPIGNIAQASSVIKSKGGLLVAGQGIGKTSAIVSVTEESQVVAVVPDPEEDAGARPVDRSRPAQAVAGAQKGLHHDAGRGVGSDRVCRAAPGDDAAVAAGGLDDVRVPLVVSGVLLQVGVQG